MTQEQKGAVRADQIEVLTEHFSTAGFPPVPARKLAEDTVAEAEARGAEEARRVDAEGQEPVAWNYYDEEDDDDRGGWRYSSSKPSSRYEDVHPLYTRPANVAALEARVKEVVAALKTADQFITNGIEFGFIRMPDSDTPDSALATPGIIRAALTREGGE